MKLSRTFGLSISLVRFARRDDPSSHNYNCFMWAFGLLDREWLTGLIPERRDIYPRSDFADYLVCYYLEEISEQEARAGDVVVYFKDAKPVHAGTLDSGLVVSKWGLFSHLWKHGMCELPIEYGDEARFYRSLPENIIREAFKKWCHHFSPALESSKALAHQTIPPLKCADWWPVGNDPELG